MTDQHQSGHVRTRHYVMGEQTPEQYMITFLRHHAERAALEGQALLEFAASLAREADERAAALEGAAAPPEPPRTVTDAPAEPCRSEISGATRTVTDAASGSSGPSGAERVSLGGPPTGPVAGPAPRPVQGPPEPGVYEDAAVQDAIRASARASGGNVTWA